LYKSHGKRVQTKAINGKYCWSNNALSYVTDRQTLKFSSLQKLKILTTYCHLSWTQRTFHYPYHPEVMNSLGTKVEHVLLRKVRYPCPPAGFKRAVPISQRPQTHALDRAATRIGTAKILQMKNSANYGRRMQYSNSMQYSKIC
jgi:hypothetical protein